MREIDYEVLLKNVSEMIELLEYDAMRSAGKAKMNSQHIHSLYEMKDRYTAKLETKKPTPVKKEG